MARILIVDDDEADRVLLVTILERAGHEVFLAEDGEDALDEYGRRAIEVVITDLQMPKVHGLELITVLRDLSPRPAIIAISGTGSAQLDMAQAVGAEATLGKPVDPDKLLNAVAKAVLDRLTTEADRSVPSRVVPRALPSGHAEFGRLMGRLTTEMNRAPVFVELGHFLSDLAAGALSRAVTDVEWGGLPGLLRNYVAAMVEEAVYQKRVAPPAWVRDVAPLERPHFVGGLQSIHPHQMRVSPVAFKRRNIFVDPGAGAPVAERVMSGGFGSLESLNTELAAFEVEGELCLVDGAVMCLALNASPPTRHVSALFRPTRLIQEAAARVAVQQGLPGDWLTEAAKEALKPAGDFGPFLQLPNLRVFVGLPEYLLAMKCAAMRLGEEFRELDDVRHLLRHLNISSVEEALGVVARYFGERQLAARTRRALEELVSG